MQKVFINPERIIHAKDFGLSESAPLMMHHRDAEADEALANARRLRYDALGNYNPSSIISPDNISQSSRNTEEI